MRIPTPPVVQLVGEIDHPDFEESVDLLRSQSRVIAAARGLPELIVIAQSRPEAVGAKHVEALRRAAPLAGIVALVGSWCEGETRTGRPWPGVERLYWYEFPAWWRRQFALRAAGLCPGWARPDGSRWRSSISMQSNDNPSARPPSRGLVSLHIASREIAITLADVLHRAGYATAWQSATKSAPTFRGDIAGIWDGGQLNAGEADNLARTCRRLAGVGAPVIAILDFPRRDKVDQALQLGAAVVLGKPWVNHELIETVQAVVEIKFARAA